MNITAFKYFLFFLFVANLFSACEKLDNELSDVVLNSPYDSSSGIPLIVIDSMKKDFGSLPNLRGFFHIDTTITAKIDVERLILYRDGVEKARLSPGNFSFFVDITAQVHGTYNYQLSMIMKDNSYTKKTPPYIITF